MESEVDEDLHYLGFEVPAFASLFDGIDLRLNQPVINKEITLHAGSPCPVVRL